MSARRKAGLPSPALLVAVIALVAALAGTATALPGKNAIDKNDIKKGAVTKKAIKKGAVTTKAIKNAAVTGDKIADGEVREAKLANGAVSTSKIAEGAVTDAKVQGVLPVAYAYINEDQELSAENSLGLSPGVNITFEGSFVCFNGLGFTPKNIQVTVARVGGSAQSVFPNAFAPGTDNTFCSGSEQASVQFLNDEGSLAAPPRFYITFFD